MTDHDPTKRPAQHPYRPLFVEVPREPVIPRHGALDMTALARMCKRHYGR